MINLFICRSYKKIYSLGIRTNVSVQFIIKGKSGIKWPVKTDVYLSEKGIDIFLTTAFHASSRFREMEIINISRHGAKVSVTTTRIQCLQKAKRA